MKAVAIVLTCLLFLSVAYGLVAVSFQFTKPTTVLQDNPEPHEPAPTTRLLDNPEPHNTTPAK